MKLSTKFPQLIILTGLLAFAYAISAMWSAPALDPGAYVAAHATATAIAPAIYPTQQYNANVLPELQRVERDEISETTRNKQSWQRTTDTAAAVARISMTGAFAFGVTLCFVGIGLGVGGWFGARGVREIRRAALPMTRRLGEGPHITELGTITHTATGATWAIDAPQDAQPEHARLVSATYEAVPPQLLASLLQVQRREWERVGLITD